MNGIDRSRIKWKNLKQRLGLKGMGCCGATWSPRTRTITIIQEQEHEINTEELTEVSNHQMIIPQAENSTTPLLVGQQVLASPGMNLAMALEAERNLRNAGPTNDVSGGHVMVKTLMRLIEETDGVDWKNKKQKKSGTGDVGVGVGGGGEVESDWVCCVCMDRNKGAAFVPCGHTFCRICSRELWVKRGSCPICNRSILEILDIF